MALSCWFLVFICFLLTLHLSSNSSLADWGREPLPWFLLPPQQRCSRICACFAQPRWPSVALSSGSHLMLRAASSQKLPPTEPSEKDVYLKPSQVYLNICI